MTLACLLSCAHASFLLRLGLLQVVFVLLLLEARLSAVQSTRDRLRHLPRQAPGSAMLLHPLPLLRLAKCRAAVTLGALASRLQLREVESARPAASAAAQPRLQQLPPLQGHSRFQALDHPFLTTAQ
jgi:hypothetical protein